MRDIRHSSYLKIALYDHAKNKIVRPTIDDIDLLYGRVVAKMPKDRVLMYSGFKDMNREHIIEGDWIDYSCLRQRVVWVNPGLVMECDAEITAKNAKGIRKVGNLYVDTFTKGVI